MFVVFEDFKVVFVFFFRVYFVLEFLEEELDDDEDEDESFSSLERGDVFSGVNVEGVKLKKDKYCLLLFGDFIEEVE